MKTKESVLLALERNRQTYTSGEQLAEELGVSRQAIWKAVRALQEDGYRVTCVTGLGYIIEEDCDKISDQVLQQLTGIDCVYFDSVTSTMDVSKTLPCDKAHLVVAERQTAGRARFGEFPSPQNGVYFTLCTPVHLHIQDLLPLREKVASGVISALKVHCGVDCQTQNVDELLFDGKKIGGVMTEVTYNANTQTVTQLTCGVGIYTLQRDNLLIPQETRNRLIADIVKSILNEI